MPTTRARDRALVAAIAILAVWDLLVRSQIHDEGARVVVAALLGLLLVGIGIAGGLTAAALGLGRDRLLPGCVYGLVVMLAVTLVLTVGAVLPPTHHYFHSAQAEVSAGRLWVKALVVIPVGTVVLEELAFRGTLLGLLLERTTVVRAVLITSVLFGLWHLEPVVASTGGGFLRVVAACAGTFVATSVAGAVFAWLRLRSGSLVAPALAHVGTNSLALIVAWIVVH